MPMATPPSRTVGSNSIEDRSSTPTAEDSTCGTQIGTKIGWWFIPALICTVLSPAVAQATNGLNLIGSGGISTALAGADTAVATDFSAMNTNPAGMSQIEAQHAGASVTVIQPQLTFMNNINNRGGEDDPILASNMGYIHHLTDWPVTLGIGLFSVGGTSAEFTDLNTPFNTIDKVGATIRHYSLTPSIAYQVSEQLSLGITFGISYSDASFTLLPNTAVPGFAGFEIKGNCTRANGLGLPGSCPYAVGFRPKFGAMYKPHKMVTLGLVYTAKTVFAYDHGKATRNQPGIGVVNYDVDASGFKWPDDIAFGLAVRPNDRLLISTKVQWINWDAALNSVTFNFRNGDNPLAPNATVVQPFNWSSQLVFALGAAYDVTDRLNLRAAYNYGNDPIPGSTLEPTSPTIVEHHLTTGAAYHITPSLLIDGTFDYAVTNKRTFNSALFGASKLEVGGYDFTLSLTYWN